MVAFAPEITLDTSSMLFVPVFPPKMLLRYVYLPARVDDAAGSAAVQLGLYRVVQPTQVVQDVVPKSGKHEFDLIQKFIVSYRSGSLSSAVAAVAGTALISLQSYTRVVGRLDNALMLDPGIQYAIGIRPLGSYSIEMPAPHLLVDAPCYTFTGASTNLGKLPISVAVGGRERTPVLTLLSPRGANILAG